MDIYAKAGTKVRFLNANGFDAERQNARKYLLTDQTYTVDSIKVGSFVSYVRLKEYPQTMFNTVMFEEASPHDR